MRIIFVVVAAFIAGGMNAIAGGGTFLTFPALTAVAGLSEKMANMTSTIGLWPGSLASVFAAGRALRRIPRGLLLAYGLISVIGGLTGSLLLIHTSERSFRLVVPWLLAFATIIFALSKPIAVWAGRQHGGRSIPWEILVGLIQFAVAVYGGYFGAGIGVLMLAGLSFAGFEDIHQLNALKVLLAMLINGMAIIVFVSAPIDWHCALPMAAGSAAGGFLGMSLARRMPQKSLRWLILAVGILLTCVYFYRVYLA